MTLNEDQLKAYIKQTAWEVGEEFQARLEKHVTTQIELHSLKCQNQIGVSGKAVAGITTIISGVVVGVIECVRAYFSSKGQ